MPRRIRPLSILVPGMAQSPLGRPPRPGLAKAAVAAAVSSIFAVFVRILPPGHEEHQNECGPHNHRRVDHCYSLPVQVVTGNNRSRESPYNHFLKRAPKPVIRKFWISKNWSTQPVPAEDFGSQRQEVGKDVAFGNLGAHDQARGSRCEGKTARSTMGGIRMILPPCLIRHASPYPAKDAFKRISGGG
jgi:hypothetical protein